MSLVFRESDHTYWLDGTQVPSVNQVLTDMGFQDGYEHIPAFYAQRGTMVHEATVMLDHGTLAIEALDERLVPFVYAYQKFCAEHEYEPYSWEEIVHHPTHLYAGTLDRRSVLGGRPLILDIKTSKRSHYWHHLQIAGYRACGKDAWFVDGEIEFEGALLYLTDDGNYRLVPMKPGAPDRWEAVITAYNLKHNRAEART